MYKHNRLKPHYVYVVIKIIKFYMNYSIIAIVMGIILSVIGNFIEHSSKA